MHLTLLERPRFKSPIPDTYSRAVEMPRHALLHAPLYDRLANHIPTPEERAAAADVLRNTLQQVAHDADDLPENPAEQGATTSRR